MPFFPGMDPFIEGQIWQDFHTAYVVSLRDQLVPQLGDRYFAMVEVRVYIEHHMGPQPVVVPDVTITAATPRGAAPVAAPSGSQPVLIPLVMPAEMRERFLTIHARDTREVVAVIELLSPTNKRAGSDGRREYLTKRENVLRSSAHLVELDLLRGGERLPMGATLPRGDYYAILSRASQRPLAEVWWWSLADPLPTIAVPLAEADPDVRLDLQAAFEGVFQRGGYQRMLDYAQSLQPVASEQQAEWIRQRLKADGGVPE